jgi:hypothetical protein
MIDDIMKISPLAKSRISFIRYFGIYSRFVGRTLRPSYVKSRCRRTSEQNESDVIRSIFKESSVKIHESNLGPLWSGKLNSKNSSNGDKWL